jgi:Cu/Ag efflux protein CusF
MKSSYAKVLALALAGLAFVPACSQSKSAPAPAPASDPSTAKTYQGRGVIRGFQSEGKVVVLEHQAIPGLMEGMTMGFELADPAGARGFKLGDRVEFNLSVQGDSWTIVSMKKSQ